MSESLTVLITGATGKLGRQLALGFAAQGCSLILPSRSLQSANELKTACLLAGAQEVTVLTVDLTSTDAVIDLQSKAQRLSLFPDVLVNNARNIDYLQVDEHGLTSRENWLGEFILDVVVPYELTHALVGLSGTKLRKVINIASIYGINAPNLTLYENPITQSPINYGVAKAGLIHLTKELSVRLANKGIEVNSVSFGGVAGRVNQDFLQSYARLCPSGRMLTDQEVFGAVKFLASSDSNGMTGHNLVVDGGWTVW